MYKNLLPLCLLLAVATSTLFLTPANPPTAYQNQFYSVRFRVRGLDELAFTFEGLPKSLTGTSDGLLSGIPKTAGSIPIVIKYRSGEKSGQSQVILKIQPDYRNIDSVVTATQTKIGLVIEYPENLIFRVGELIRIPFIVKSSAGSLVWVFRGLPTGIQGDSNQGVVQGSIRQAGYYNLQVECADKEGKSGQAFITINVQPKATLTTSQLVDVNSKSNTTAYSTYRAIEAEQIAADNQLFKALDNVDTRKKIVNEAKQKTAIATLKLNNAQSSLNAADLAWKQAISDLDFAKSLLSSAQSALNAAQQNLQLALTEQNQAASALAAARKAVEEAQARFNAASKAVSEAEDNLIKAKDQLAQAQQKLRDARIAKTVAQEQYKRAYEELEAAKTQLEDARARKALADQAVKAAQDALELATQVRDNAENDLKKADFALAEAEKTLDVALKKLALIREKYNIAKEELSAAQWNWETAINKLYVAQARKETADRASAIALAEGSLSDHNGNNGYNTIGGSSNASFGGCEARSYPVISGSSSVVSVSTNGYTLASGHNIVYGSCSSVANCQVGDFVKYNGYIVNGVVNALRIQRVLLS